MEEQNTHIDKAVYRTALATPGLLIRQYVQSGFVENCDFKQVFIHRQLERIDLSATNVTFVTKDEFESHFLGKHNEEPKFNHRVNTTLNQL